jgi:hypothetical protein
LEPELFEGAGFKLADSFRADAKLPPNLGECPLFPEMSGEDELLS